MRIAARMGQIVVPISSMEWGAIGIGENARPSTSPVLFHIVLLAPRMPMYLTVRT